MKTVWVLLVVLCAAMATMGFSCVNDSFLVVVNLPISAEYAVTPGNGAFNSSADVALSSQIDESYVNKVQAIRFYDIRVSTSGNYAGPVSGTIYIRQKPSGAEFPILTFSGNWADFSTPQSILTSKKLTFTPQALASLQSLLGGYLTNRSMVVTVRTSGTTGAGAYTGDQKVKVEILCQTDAEMGGN